MRNSYVALAMLATTIVTPPFTARNTPAAVWQVSRSSDPITTATTGVVAAYDRAGGTTFSRTGALYPFVENSSTHGLLVGVSSGGKWRLPTGNIVWRVDSQPFRMLQSADNPAGRNASAIPSGNAAMTALVEQQMRLIAAITATSTVASGDTARAMLAELLAGTGLVFRAAATTTSYGLPTGAGQRVGQITKDGLRPIPLDDSLRAGLATCGISVVAGE